MPSLTPSCSAVGAAARRPRGVAWFWMRRTGNPSAGGGLELRLRRTRRSRPRRAAGRPDRDVDVRRRGTRAPTRARRRGQEARLDVLGDAGKPRKLWKPITSRPGPRPSSAASDDEILERVAAGVEVRREAVERHAERGSEAVTSPPVVSVFTQRSRITSGLPDSTMYGIRSAIVTSSSCSPGGRARRASAPAPRRDRRRTTSRRRAAAGRRAAYVVPPSDEPELLARNRARRRSSPRAPRATTAAAPGTTASGGRRSNPSSSGRSDPSRDHLISEHAPSFSAASRMRRRIRSCCPRHMS